MNQDKQNNPLVFILNDDTPSSAAKHSTDMEDWEKDLLRLQQKRRYLSGQENGAAAEAPRQIFTLEEPSPPPPPKPVPAKPAFAEAGRRRKLSLEEQKQTYQAYLEHWQQQHNNRQPESGLDNPQILFQEDWLNAQNSLYIGRHDEAAAQATVWLNNRRPARVSEGQTILDKLQAMEAAEAAAQAEQAGPADADNPKPDASPALPEGNDEAALAAAAEKIVLLNIYAPPESAGRKMLCLSEPLLLEQLAEKLRPHLADAVAGMVKTAVQKQTAMMLQQMQQSFLDEVPQLVDDILRHNLSRALNAVKREQL